LTFGQPRIDQGHFGHFGSRKALWVLWFGIRMGYATSFWMFSHPHEEKMIFLDFLGFGTQNEGEQNTASTPITRLTSK